MRNIIKSEGRERIIDNTHSNWYLEDHNIFKDDLVIFAQNASNFINIFTGTLWHDVIIKFYEKEKGGK